MYWTQDRSEANREQVHKLNDQLADILHQDNEAVVRIFYGDPDELEHMPGSLRNALVHNRGIPSKMFTLITEVERPAMVVVRRSMLEDYVQV